MVEIAGFNRLFNKLFFDRLDQILKHSSQRCWNQWKFILNSLFYPFRSGVELERLAVQVLIDFLANGLKTSMFEIS